MISTVNLAEVITRLALAGMPETAIREALALLPLESVSFDVGQAIEVGLLAPTTRPSGPSLGDRACAWSWPVISTPLQSQRIRHGWASTSGWLSS